MALTVDDSAMWSVEATMQDGARGRLSQGPVKLTYASTTYATNGVSINEAALVAGGAVACGKILGASVADINDPTLVGLFDRTNLKLKLYDIADGAEVSNGTSTDGLVVTLNVLGATAP